MRAADGIVITADVSLKLLLGGTSSARVYRDPNRFATPTEWASQPLHSAFATVGGVRVSSSVVNGLLRGFTIVQRSKSDLGQVGDHCASELGDYHS